jgi:hypothetical protein
MSPTVENRPICVLTVGRSGSSLAARALALLGAELGPDAAMLPADQHNEAGYWEPREMNQLGDDLLAALGANLWDPPALPDGWEHDPIVEPFRCRARELVERLRPNDRRWAFKDARSIYLLPLWHELVGPMDYVICVRAAADVVASLSRLLPDRPRDEWWAVYLQGNATAVRRTAGERRLILHYEDWSTDPDTIARRLGEFVGVTVDEEALARVRGAFDDSLWHQRAVGADVPVEAGAMDAALRVLSERDDPALEAFAGGLDASYFGRLERERAASEAVGRAEAEAAQSQARADAARREVEELAAERDELHAYANGLAARVRSVEGSATWRVTAPLRALRHGGPARAMHEVRAILSRK